MIPRASTPRCKPLTPLMAQIARAFVPLQSFILSKANNYRGTRGSLCSSKD